MPHGSVPIAALPVRVRHRAVPCPTEVSRSRHCPSEIPCPAFRRTSDTGAFFCRCTRSDDRVVTLYVNRHFNPINRTRSRPSNETLFAVASSRFSNETLFAVASSRFSIAALYAVASSRRMKSDHHEVIFSLFQAGRRSCSATYVYSPCPCRTLWPVEELLF